jgi:hypothetical protein
MHPIIERDTMQARVTDLHRKAERDRIARAVSAARHDRREKRRRNLVPGCTAVLVRRVLDALGALIPSPTR